MKIIAFSCLACLLLAGCLTPKDVPSIAEKCSGMNKSQRNTCYENTAREVGDASICNHISEAGFRVLCKQNIAVDTCDESICNTILESWKQDSCFVEVRKVVSAGNCK